MARAALRQRGSLSIWFDPETQWLAAPTGKRGRQPVFCDAAVQTCLTLRALLGLVAIGAPLVRATMATRQVTGMVASLLVLAGLDWPVPDYSTLSRRQKGLAVAISHRPGTGALHLLIDIEPVSATGSSEPARGDQGGRRWRMVCQETRTVKTKAIVARQANAGIRREGAQGSPWN